MIVAVVHAVSEQFQHLARVVFIRNIICGAFAVHRIKEDNHCRTFSTDLEHVVERAVGIEHRIAPLAHLAPFPICGENARFSAAVSEGANIVATLGVLRDEMIFPELREYLEELSFGINGV